MNRQTGNVDTGQHRRHLSLRNAAPLLALIVLVVMAATSQIAAGEPASPAKPDGPLAAVPIIGWEYDQMHPAVAFNSQWGEYVVVWEDHHWAWGAEADIYGRRTGTNGVPVGDQFGVAWTGDKKRLAPEIAYNPTLNEYLVVWEYEYATSDHDIYAQRLAANGSLIGGEIAVAGSGSFERSPRLAYNASDEEYLVVWDVRVGSDEFVQYDIYGQRLSMTGTRRGNVIVISTEAQDQASPAVAHDRFSNQYLVVWQNKYSGTGRYAIRCQLISGAGALLGNFWYTAADRDYLTPKPAFNSQRREFLIVWEANPAGAGAAIIGARVGVGPWYQGTFPISTPGGNRRQKPAVAYMPSADEYLVAWEYDYSATDHDIYRRRVAANEAMLGDETVVSSLTSREAGPAVAGDGSQAYLIAWEDSRDGAVLGVNIYADLVQAPLPTVTPTRTPTRTFTATLTRTPTRTFSATPTRTPSMTAIPSPSATRTTTWTAIPTATLTRTPTSTTVPSASATRTATLTTVPSATTTGTASPAPTVSPTRTGTRTGSATATVTATRTGSATGTATATATATSEAPPAFLPDLMITDAWNEGATICYQVRNAGEAAVRGEHAVALFVEGAHVAGDPLGGGLAPAARLTRCFAYTWECTGGADGIVVAADAGQAIAESSEDNNRRQESWRCDVRPPRIKDGPIVRSIAQSSLVIVWETDEASDSRVRYGRRAGIYSSEALSLTPVVDHVVPIGNLEAGTAYHFIVESSDSYGNTAASRDYVFETLPALDLLDPTVLLVAPALLQGSTIITATASDNQAVERVEFYMNDVLIFTDYAAPYALPLETERYANGSYTLRARAVDKSGRWSINDRVVGVANPIDLTAPRVAILSPAPGVSVTGKITITAAVTDDTGLLAAYVYIDGAPTGFEPFPSRPTQAKAEMEWDTKTAGDGSHRIAVIVYDKDGKAATATVDVIVYTPAALPAPVLTLTSHKATRYQNGAGIELTVKNTGAGVATNVYIDDFLHAFQPISRTSTIPTLASYAASYTPWTQWWDCLITSYVDIHPGQSYTFSYGAIPVMVHPTQPAPSIGDVVKLYYDGLDGQSYSSEVKAPLSHTTGGETIAQAYANALKQADYLIVSDPSRLIAYGYNQNEIDGLLSDMAQLAAYKFGVLGYVSSPTAAKLKSLVVPGGDWAKQMHPDFSKSLGGYLLLVGETEIIPAWTQSGFSIDWGPVPYSDHPYADTGGTPSPDLIVGRIIGDSAAALSKPIQASNGVYGNWPGYAFDRDRALLVSDGGLGAFVKDVETAATILQGKGFSVYKMHYKDYYVASSFTRPHNADNGYAIGDVNGDGVAEIVVADAANNRVAVYTSTGALLTQFNSVIDAGDRLAVGNVAGDAGAEIIIGDASADTISLYNGSGALITSFSVPFDDGDVLASGNVMGYSRDQILFGDASADYIYAFEMQATWPDFSLTPVVATSLSASFDPDDALASGNVAGDTRDEVVIGDISQDRVYVRRMDLGLWSWFTTTLKTGDWLAVGNVRSEASDQVIVAAQGERLWVWQWITPTQTWQNVDNIPADIAAFDGLAVGDVGDIMGRRQDEVLVAHSDNGLRIFDLTNVVTRLHKAFPALTQDRDVVYWSGHGNVNVWSNGLNAHGGAGDFPIDFGGHNPIILGTSCLTGNYQDGGSKENKNIAEAFLQRGAAVYIGATNSSHGYEDRTAAQKLWTDWAPYETIGKAFTDVEQSYWKGSTSDDWWFWVWEYNLYGDPKFGDEPPFSRAPGSNTAAAPAPPATLDIAIPDYVLDTIDGLDTAEIPGGYLLLEPGQPWLPYWVESVELPAGYNVQEVIMTGRSGLSETLGLNLAFTPETIARCSCRPQPAPGTGDGWLPEKAFEWRVINKPDGTATLAILVYPFFYNAQTTGVQFFTSYQFVVGYSVSPAGVTSLATDQDVYAQGETVAIAMALHNGGPVQNVLVDVVIRRYGSSEQEAGLLLNTLHSFAGAASYSLLWDTAGAAAGHYYVEATLRDMDGRLLASRTAAVSVGRTRLEVTALTVTPARFSPGQLVTATLAISNTGDVTVTGLAVIRVLDERGVLVDQLTSDTGSLAPGSPAGVSLVWKTAGVAAGSYTLAGHVAYDSAASAPHTAVVAAGARLYLPVILGGYP